MDPTCGTLPVFQQSPPEFECIGRFYLFAHEITGIYNIAVNILLFYQLLELIIVVRQRIGAEWISIRNNDQFVPDLLPGARRSAEDRLVASVAPMTEAREAPLSLTTGGIVGSFIIQKIALTGESTLSTRFGTKV